MFLQPSTCIEAGLSVSFIFFTNYSDKLLCMWMAEIETHLSRVNYLCFNMDIHVLYY